jgi:hypothetical protein
MRDREGGRERPRSWSHKATWRPRLEKEHDANISLSLSSLLFVSASLLAFSLLFVAMTWEENLLPLQVFNLNLNGVVFFIHFYRVRIRSFGLNSNCTSLPGNRPECQGIPCSTLPVGLIGPDQHRSPILEQLSGPALRLLLVSQLRKLPLKERQIDRSGNKLSIASRPFLCAWTLLLGVVWFLV